MSARRADRLCRWAWRAAGTLGLVAWIGAAAPAAGATPPPAAPAADPGFRQFIDGLWPLAQARNIPRATFDAAFQGVTLDPKLVKLTDTQSEFVRPIWAYLASAVNAQRVAAGKAKGLQWKDVLAKVEARFGVDRSIVLAIWGIESGYGAFTGDQPVIRELATLAYTKYQGEEAFRDELLDALEILAAGDVGVAGLRGSLAGAMGQTQFMPSSFKKFAVDFDDDGHRNIWTSVPDALASTANFLHGQGWIAGQPWGVEVILPKGFDASHGEESKFAPFADWAARGVTRAGGGALPATGEAALLIPAGLRGPAFLITRNFKVIKAYNNSTAYALSVALIADRIAGKGGLVGTWPVHAATLSVAQAKELQRLLKQLGYDVGAIDGKIGEQARDALLAYQAKSGLLADGFPTVELIERMRAGR